MLSEKPPRERERARKVWRRMWACARGCEGWHEEVSHACTADCLQAGCGQGAGMAKVLSEEFRARTLSIESF